MPGTVLGAGNTTMSKTKYIPHTQILMEFTILDYETAVRIAYESVYTFKRS